MTIGELAEQAGVSTRTLRFWADEGLIPCDRTVGGYRLFGSEALPVAGLIRVLREVDVDLATIRSILEGRRELAGVVATHVDVIDARIALLRFQRSVLRAVASVKEPTTQELQIMYDLANLTADQRRQIISELVDETFAGLDDAGPVADKMRDATPDLPHDPSPEQVAAWVELAQLVQDPAFRTRARQMALAGAQGGAGNPALAAAVSEHAARPPLPAWTQGLQRPEKSSGASSLPAGRWTIGPPLRRRLSGSPTPASTGTGRSSR